MKCVLLGTGGYHPSNERHTMCVMVPEAGLVLDAGTALFRVRQRLEIDTLDIFLSHTHLDHVVGLTYLLTTLRDDQLQPRTFRHVRVHAASEKLAAVRHHLFSEQLFPILPDVQWQPLQGPVSLPGRATLHYFPLEHPGGSLGFRVNWPDRSLAYVTDTTARPDAAYLDQIRGVDLLLHECYLTDPWEAQAAEIGHSSLSNVARVAAAAEVGSLILIHMNPLFPLVEVPDLESARRLFPATQLGVDLMEVIF